jgi:ABC-type multidrug transport system fused ATPase/permease subunit
MTRQERITHYKSLAAKQQLLSQSLKKQIYLCGTLRLVVFLAMGVIIYLLFNVSWTIFVTLFVGAILFARLLSRQRKLSQQKSYADALVKIANDELKTFEGDYSSFNGAKERIDPMHDFSFDLDIFGERSVFQLLNRTALPLGQHRLADYLEFPLREKNVIEQRQEAVKELAQFEDFCLTFRKLGSVADGGFSNLEEVTKTFSTNLDFPNRPFWQAAAVAVPLLYIVLLALVLAGVVSVGAFGLLYVATLGLSMMPMKRIMSILNVFNKKTKQLDTYAQLFQLIERTPFKSHLAKRLQNAVLQPVATSKNIAKLDYYYRNLDVTFSPAIFFLNPFLLNVRYALKINKWMQFHAAYTEKWFDVLAEFDALISLGTFAANNPDFSFPGMADSFVFQGKNLGHPLLSREKCVANDINIDRKPYFMIVTGANMAGKSTYLRTVSINHLLASVGAPVYADSLRFYPGRLLTNLRTADSLVNSESYFFAELKRLKMIIDTLKSSTESGLFIILDEILKGTNSEDKQKGSFALMKRLVNLGGNGIIATHDLALGALENEFPDAVRNYHFDATIIGDTLTLDYRLHRGIAKNMNASFLMKSMGITE